MAKKILIVDDEPGMVSLIEGIVKSANYDAVTAQNGQEALDKIEQDMPDLVVLDMMMPKIDGYTVFKNLRSSPKYKNIPIIILTGDTEFENVKKCIAEGVEAYLTKPFQLEAFLGLIKGLLGE